MHAPVAVQLLEQAVQVRESVNCVSPYQFADWPSGGSPYPDGQEADGVGILAHTVLPTGGLATQTNPALTQLFVFLPTLQKFLALVQGFAGIESGVATPAAVQLGVPTT